LFAANVVEHVATHLSLPSRWLNAPMERAVRRMWGPTADDPRIHCNDMVSPIPFKLVSTFGKDVALVTNPLHFVLFGAVFVGWVIGLPRRRMLLVRVGGVVTVGAMLYCMLFKWQLWTVRLTLPLYGWMAVGVGVWLEDRWVRWRRGMFGVVAICAVAQAVMRPVWFMPAFFFGEGPEGSGLSYDMSVADKMRRLAERRYRSTDMSAMRTSVPEVEKNGYSLFYTPRQRQYFGNETYRNASWRYAQLAETLRCVVRVRRESGVSKTVGLLISSDHSNLPPEVRREPFPCEYPMWTWGGCETDKTLGGWNISACRIPWRERGKFLARKAV
jgi:hypothetical protein